MTFICRSGKAGWEIDFYRSIFDGEADFALRLANDFIEGRQIAAEGGGGDGEDRVGLAGIFAGDGGGLDGKSAGKGGVPGGKGQMHEDQFNASGIGLSGAGGGPEKELQCDLIAQGALQQIVEAGD